MPSVFIVGATGYIGDAHACSVLTGIIKRYPDWTFAALVRNEKHFEPLRSVGVTVVPGSFADKSLISEQARLADIVFNAADCDDLPLTEAILSGMKKRFEEGKPKGILIHTSGTAIFLDWKPDGKFDPEGKIWNDANEDDIRSLTPSMLHGQVDVPILKAGEEGYLNAYILCPGSILGPSASPVKSATIFLKLVIPTYRKFQRAIYIGEGTSQFAFVHVDDLVDFYLRVIDVAVSGEDAGASPYERYFIVASQTESWKDIASAVGTTLHKRGLLNDATPQSVSLTESDRFLRFIAASSRFTAERGKALGWNPRILDLQTGIEENLDDALSLVAWVRTSKIKRVK